MNTRSTAYNNGMDSGGVCASRESSTAKSHHDGSLSSPRMIFPSLHGITNTHPKSNVEVKHQRGKSIDNISPADVIKPAPVLRHANSLDGLMIPMPKLSIDKSNKEFVAPKILNQRTNDVQISSTPPRASGPLFRHSISGASKFDNAKSSSRSISSTKSNISYYGDTRKYRTHYYPASVPTPISIKKSPSPSTNKPKRLTPILRRRTSSLSPSTKVLSTSCIAAAPTLASPDIIRTLHSHDNLPFGIPLATMDDDKEEGIGESEYGLEKIRDCPKLIHRSKCKIKKSQSDSIVSQNEEDLTRPRRNSISTDKCVSRHASVEAFQHRKRCQFDPHITVFQFPISEYERKGGEKWFTMDELTEFKQEAIQRIRLRSMKVIPTGTGRALAISPTQNGAKKKKSGKATGSVFFNHPALGCDEEVDPSESISKEWQLHTDLSKEIRNILVVDPHEIFLALFTKSLNHIIPHASVATAKSTKEALSRIEAAKRAFPPKDRGATLGFDIIIIEERLNIIPSQQLASGTYKSLNQHSQTAGDNSAQQFDMTSGSSLIRYLAKGDIGDSMRLTLIVGVSANKTEHTKLKRAGADCVWGKPPPKMNSTLRNDLLELLMKKRNSTVTNTWDDK